MNLWQLNAREAVALLKKGEVSPLELVEASAKRIEETDGPVNAMPTLSVDRARAHAKRIMEDDKNTERPPGWLAGLPISVKDLTPVEGVLTTWGSPIYASHIPPRSDLVVETLEANGAICMGKSNVPEFGAGANTFNEVFGKTRNPWNTDKTCAGSSGGAAVSLATGQVWLATGSDLGGSLRTPASFCSVVGMRPSPGRVAHGPGRLPFAQLPVDGPMARNVADTALMLDAMVGHHPEDPISLAAPATSFSEAVEHAGPPTRIGFTPDLGILPVNREVAAICEKAAHRFEEMGTEVAHAVPDMSGALDAFQVLRAAQFAADKEELLQTQRHQLKPEIVWNIEKGMALTAAEIGKAERDRARLYARFIRFFKTHDLLLVPTALVPPFDVDQRWVEEVDGHKFDNYVDWLGITSTITLTGLPVLAVPAGFTADGLPVGLQIVGPPRGEAKVLAAGQLLENALGIAGQLPIEPRAATA